MIRKLVFEPERFLKERRIGPTLRAEVLTVLLVGIAGALGPIYVSREVLSEAEAEFLAFNLGGKIIEPLLVVVAVWIGYTLLAHVIANRRGSRKPIKRLFKTTAWALIPLGVGYLVRSITMIVTIERNSPNIAEGTSEEIIASAFGEGVLAEPLVIGGSVVLLVSVLVTGHLFRYAIQAAKEVPREDALIAAAVPVAFHVLVLVWMILQQGVL